MQEIERDMISIIIPVYNSEKYIVETMQTIKNQTYKNWEAIFIDDNSTDNSKMIIERYIKSLNEKNKMKLIELDKNCGPALSRNKGLEIARGKYITYLDSDDLWEKERLEKQYNFMKENNYDFTYTSYKYINKDEKISKKVKVQERLDYEEALKRIRILTITSMIKIGNIKKDMLIMPDMRRGEDIATWYKILKSGVTAYGLNEPLAIYRKTKNTLSSNKIKSMMGRWYLYRKIEGLPYFKSLYYFYHYIINAILRRI